ncbi:MAG: peptidase and chymotrypsin/Hap [Mycobacterium sp.]|nr:peptidase and chymotrypsin/Hap [Mycobacterium sp.]
MQQRTQWWRGAVVASVVAVAMALLSPTVTPARAADLVPLGGGSGIVINGEAFCTLTAIGTDSRGNLIGFTSAHCGGPGAQVASEAAENQGILGTMVAGNDALDYAVIQFDRARVLPVNNVNGFQIDGIGPDPAFGEVSCKLGRTTGYSCGVTWGPGKEPGTIVSQVCGQPGDSGAPVTVNNRLVGMIHGAFSEELPTCVVKFVPLHTPAVTMSINAVLADITAKNRPGSGFVPVGAVPAA